VTLRCPCQAGPAGRDYGDVSLGFLIVGRTAGLGAPEHGERRVNFTALGGCLSGVWHALESDGYAVTGDRSIGLPHKFRPNFRGAYFNDWTLRHDDGDMPVDRLRARDVIRYHCHDGRLGLQRHEAITITDRAGIKGRREHARVELLDDPQARELIQVLLHLVPPADSGHGARAAISVRLAPGDDAERAFQALKDHLLRDPPWNAEVTVTRDHQSQPHKVDATGPAFDAFRRACADTPGRSPVEAGSGGSAGGRRVVPCPWALTVPGSLAHSLLINSFAIFPVRTRPLPCGVLGKSAPMTPTMYPSASAANSSPPHTTRSPIPGSLKACPSSPLIVATCRLHVLAGDSCWTV
jgi:hypothetical protein